MRLLPWILCFFALSLLPLGVRGQAYIGLGGGGGIPDEVLFRATMPVEVFLNNNISLQTELVFIQREAPEVLTNLAPSRIYIRPVINYLELPVLAKFHLPFEIVDFYGFIGPKFGYGLRLTSTFEEDNKYFQGPVNFEEASISRFDAGLSVGAGVEKTISRGNKLFIDLRYYLGLFNINKAEGEEIFNGGKTFTLGFLVPLR